VCSRIHKTDFNSWRTACGGDLLRQGFRQRAIRYVAFLFTFFLLYALWAALFGRYDVILKLIVGFPLSLSAVLVLDLVGLGRWMRKRKVTRAIPTLVLVVAILTMLVYGEPWAAVPLIVLLSWIIGYVLRQQLSMRSGDQATPPHA